MRNKILNNNLIKVLGSFLIDHQLDWSSWQMQQEEKNRKELGLKLSNSLINYRHSEVQETPSLNLHGGL